MMEWAPRAIKLGALGKRANEYSGRFARTGFRRRVVVARASLKPKDDD